MNRSVLIVDDDPTIRKVLEDYLKALGFETYHATDGYTGWDLFQKHRPALVITDIFMPGITGVELLEKIKADEKPAPVVMISGVQLSEVEIQMQRERADGFLDKPYMFWQLKDVLAKLLPETEAK